LERDELADAGNVGQGHQDLAPLAYDTLGRGGALALGDRPAKDAVVESRCPLRVVGSDVDVDKAWHRILLFSAPKGRCFDTIQFDARQRASDSQGYRQAFTNKEVQS